MPRVVFDPAVSSIVVDLLLEAANDRSSLLIPVVLDTGASMTIIATDIMGRLGYDPANPALHRQRIVTGSGIEYAPCTSVRSATAIGQKLANLDVRAMTYLQKAAWMDFSDSTFSNTSSLPSVFAMGSLTLPGNAKPAPLIP